MLNYHKIKPNALIQNVSVNASKNQNGSRADSNVFVKQLNQI